MLFTKFWPAPLYWCLSTYEAVCRQRYDVTCSGFLADRYKAPAWHSSINYHTHQLQRSPPVLAKIRPSVYKWPYATRSIFVASREWGNFGRKFELKHSATLVTMQCSPLLQLTTDVCSWCSSNVNVQLLEWRKFKLEGKSTVELQINAYVMKVMKVEGEFFTGKYIPWHPTQTVRAVIASTSMGQSTVTSLRSGCHALLFLCVQFFF